MFPSTVVTSNHEQLVMNAPFQASLSSHVHHTPTANRGDAFVVHPESQASLGMGPSHVQVTGMREVYPGMETQLIRPPSAPLLPQHLPTTFYQLFPSNSPKEHFLAKGFPVSNSSAVLIPSTHHPLLVHPSPFPSSHVHPSPLSSSHVHPSLLSSSHAHHSLLPTNQQPPVLAPLHPQSYTGVTAVYPSHLAHNHYNPVTMATQNVVTQSAPVPSHATPSQSSLRPQNVVTILSSIQQPPPSPAIQLKPATAFTEFSFNKKPILACLKR